MKDKIRQLPHTFKDGANDIIKIMIVDDHQIIIDGLKSSLSQIKNFKIVAEANTGKDAIDSLSKISADVILMDVEMPVMNGWDATKIITSTYPDTKIIALTTFNEKAIVKKMISSGASGYILKNIKKETLREAIVSVYNGEQYFSSEISLTLLKSSAEEVIIPQEQTSSVQLLSSREIEILKLIAGGLSNAEIGEKLFISPKTVKVHRENIMKKLDLHNAVGLVRYAINAGLLK